MLQTNQNQTCVERNSIGNTPRAIELKQKQFTLATKICCNVVNRYFSTFRMTILTLLFILSFNDQLLSQTSWTQIGQKNPQVDISNYNQNFSGIGLVQKVMFEPKYNRFLGHTRLFAWAYSGVWVSETGQGNDWINMNTDQLEDAAFDQIAVDPSDRDHIIASTGSKNGIKFQSPQHGIELKYSTGFWEGKRINNNWEWNRLQPYCAFEDGGIMVIESDFFKYENHRLVTNICINQNDPSELLCIVVEISNHSRPNETYRSKVYHSFNGGNTWELKLNINNIFLKDILCVDNITAPMHSVYITGKKSPTSADILFRSDDFGDTWPTPFYSTVVAGTTTAYQQFFANFNYYNVTYSQNTPDYIYITGFTNSTCQTLKINKSTNQASALHTSFGFNVFNDNGKSDAFEVNPNDADQFMYGGHGLAYVKFIAGAFAPNFPKEYGGYNYDFHQDLREVTYYPELTGSADANNCIVACDGGVFKGVQNPDVGSGEYYTWTNISNGLEMLNATDISCTQNDNKDLNGNFMDEVLVNTWDNGTYQRNALTGKWFWRGYEGHEVTAHPYDYNKFYSQEHPDVFLGGTHSYGYTNSFLHNSSRGVFNPQNPKQFFLVDNYQINNVAGTGVVRVTEDNSGGITESLIGPVDNDLTAIDICASNPNVIVIAKYLRISTNIGRMYKTTDGGINWSIVDVPFTNGLNEITYTIISPTNQDKMWVSDYSNKVAVTTNGGSSWVTQFLPDEVKAIYTLYYLRGSNDMIFAGTSAGLYVFQASSNSWIQYNPSFSNPNNLLPRSLITGIDYNYNTQTMFVSTFGRGVWKGRVSCTEIQGGELVISGNETWNFPMTVNGNIHILPGATLHVTNILRMGTNNTINIDVGGKLLVVNGTITSLCPTTSWGGIVADGNLLNNQQMSQQGYVGLSQNSVIENAKIGALLRNGAMINAYNATFRNCIYGISILSINLYESKNKISSCIFIVDRITNGINSAWNGGIIITNAQSVLIEGCHFECSELIPKTLLLDRGFGIKINEGSAKIIRAADPGAVLIPSQCNPPTGIPNTFVQLREGILVNNTQTSQPVDIFECIFTNCAASIDLSFAQRSRVYKNTIIMENIYGDIQLSPTGGSEYFGIRSFNTVNFIMEQNVIQFRQLLSGKAFVGIDIDGSNSNNPLMPSFVFSNTVTSFMGYNITNNFIGIRTNNDCYQTHFWCNTLDGLSMGIRFYGNQQPQSSFPPTYTPVCANNKFPNTATPSRIEGLAGAALFIYYYYNPIPDCYVFTPFGSNITCSPINPPNPSNDQCGNTASPSDYYCNTGKGKLETGDPIDIGPVEVQQPAMKEDNTNEPNIAIKPNPSSDKITVFFSNFTHPESAAFINLVNEEGISVMSINVINTLNSITIDVSKLPKGVYTAVLINSYGENANAKVVVTNR